jgi:hypothetical protein
MGLFDLIGAVRDRLFGTKPRHGGEARRDVWRLLQAIDREGLRTLQDGDLMALVDQLLTIPQLRRPLRGNVRFLGSVARSYHRKGTITPRQRTGIENVLQRAYPHNVVAELLRWSR